MMIRRLYRNIKVWMERVEFKQLLEKENLNKFDIELYENERVFFLRTLYEKVGNNDN